jgi:hypothetical protein
MILKATSVFSLLAILWACGGDRDEPSAMAVAYAAPATLELREDIAPTSAVIAKLKHGDPVEIVGLRRRFMKVRTATGAVGWTHQRRLLNENEMAGLRHLEEQGKKLPPQGVATVLGALNVHTLPARMAPTFYQIQEGEKMVVLARKLAPRETLQRESLIPPRPKAAPARKKKVSKYPPPPLPPPPTPPENWLELSQAPADVPEEEQPKIVAMEEWTLIRTSSGYTGWVLSNAVYMAIPDQVAQYAEGKRITSYFSLGEVKDGGEVKHHWLWTTSSNSSQPYDFDAFRVFIWNGRRHRYETAYIDRNAKGYFPVQVHPVEMPSASRAESSTYTGFSLCIEQKDGQLWRRRYALITNIVRFAGEEPCAVQRLEDYKESAQVASSGSDAPGERSLLGVLKRRMGAWRRHWGL